MSSPASPPSRAPHTVDLGSRRGRLLVFGGSYSNLQALQGFKAIADAASVPPENIIFTGDSIAYGADPQGCVDLLQNWGVMAIAGNVELQLRAGVGDCGCNFKPGSTCDRLSQQWYRYAQRHIDAAAIAWMQQLPEYLTFTYGGRRVVVVHGAYRQTSAFVFGSTPWARKVQDFAAAQAEILLSGHCGLPWLSTEDEKLWVNAGVIGMPANDGTPRAWYAVLEETGSDLIYQRRAYNYDYAQAAARIEHNHLPATYSRAIRTGLWEDCSILPPEELAAQGLPLSEQTLRFPLTTASR
ncbi:MAG: metallophosphoesterase family protein [Cyanobacteria bacterium P01_A01_bin.135]